MFLIRAKKYFDYQIPNIIERQVINHDKCFIIEKSKTEQYKHSFSIIFTVEWNHLDSDIMHAETGKGLKSAKQCFKHCSLLQCDDAIPDYTPYPHRNRNTRSCDVSPDLLIIKGTVLIT